MYKGKAENYHFVSLTADTTSQGDSGPDVKLRSM